MGWLTGKVRCQCCTYEHVSVWPEECHDDHQECPSCGSMDNEVLTYIGPGGIETPCEEQT